MMASRAKLEANFEPL